MWAVPSPLEVITNSCKLTFQMKTWLKGWKATHFEFAENYLQTLFGWKRMLLTEPLWPCDSKKLQGRRMLVRGEGGSEGVLSAICYDS